MHQNIEVEIRGLLTKECYDRIIKFLDAEGQNKELDDRKTTFFIIPEKICRSVPSNLKRFNLFVDIDY